MLTKKLINKIRNNRGITLIESLVAMFLTMIACLALLPMQDVSWTTAARADYLGRAAGLMQSELELREYQIMHAAVPADLPAPVITQPVVYVSGGPGVTGDLTYSITTTTTTIAATATIPAYYIVNVKVTWPKTTNGIESSILVTRQAGF